MSVDINPLTTVNRWQVSDWVHNGLRVLSAVVAVVALAILMRRGEFQMVPIALAGMVLGPVIIMTLFKGPERRYLLTLFFTAFALRLIAAVIAHPYLVTITTDKSGNKTAWTGFLFEDDRAYHKVAYSLLEYWTGTAGGVEKSEEYLLRLYTYLVAWLYLYVDALNPVRLTSLSKPVAGALAVMAPKLMNCFIGAVGIVPMYALGRELGGDKAGRLVAFAGAFWPSMILWSVLNLKDILVVVLIATIMYFALRFARKPSFVMAAGLLAAFAMTENLRLYIFYAFGWLVPLTFFLVNRAPPKRRLMTGMALWGAILVIMVGMNAGNQWLGFRYLTDKRVEALYGGQEFSTSNAESGIELGGRLNRSEGGWQIQMRNIPMVMPYVLWAPFPWKATRLRDFVVMPEALAWYAVQLLTILTLVVYGRSRWREFFLPVVFAGGLVFVFSIIEGNVGTIYRHRVMLFPAAFPLAAMGALWVWSWWRNRGVVPQVDLATSAPRRAVASGGLSGELT